MQKRIVKQTVAAALLTSSILSFAPITQGKEMTIQQSIDAVKLEMKKAPLYYVEPAYVSTIEPSKELYPVLNSVKKHYKEVKQKIQTSNLSTKEKNDKLKELDSLYEEKITKGVIPYIDAYNYAVKYLDPILKEMLDAHAAGDLDGVEQAYHKLSYQLDSRTSILYRFTGKAPRDLLLEKYKKPSDAKRDELRIPVTIYMKNNEVLKLWNEGKKEEARKVMDEVLTLVSKAPTDGKTNYSNLLSNEVKEAEALFSTLPIPTPTPTPEIPSKPSVGGGGNEATSESAAERKLRLAKSNAIAELESYKKDNKDDFSLINWNTILSLKTTLNSTINSATTLTEVDKALSDAKVAIDAVQTSKQEALVAVINNAINELSNYKEADEASYSLTNWAMILSLKTTWKSKIYSATTPTEVARALNDTIAAINKVKTSAQEALDEAKAQAKAGLTNYKQAEKDNYGNANWECIETLITTWTSTINAATTPTEVARALNDAKAAINKVKTSAQEALDEAITQAKAELTNYKQAEKDNYSNANWESIETLITTWTSTINAATAPDKVAQALIDAKAEIDQIAVKSNVSTINGITVKNVPAIVDNSDFSVYNVTLPTETVLANLTESDILATLTNLDAVITMTKTNGGNTWQIVVTSEDGMTTNTYTLNITITPQ